MTQEKQKAPPSEPCTTWGGFEWDKADWAPYDPKEQARKQRERVEREEKEAK